MNDKKGLININIRLVKKDEGLVDRIISARNLSEEDRESVRRMLYLNIWTIKQFMGLTGYKPSTIANKTRPNYTNGELTTELDFCYPFQNLEGTGPKFIVRNEKSEKLLP